MAQDGNKLVTLDGLKAVYSEVAGNVDDLKSAINKGIKTDNLINLISASAWKQGDHKPTTTESYKVSQILDCTSFVGKSLCIGAMGFDSEHDNYIINLRFRNSSGNNISGSGDAINFKTNQWNYKTVAVPSNAITMAVVVNTNDGSVPITPQSIVAQNPKIYLGLTVIADVKSFYVMYQGVTPLQFDNIVGRSYTVDINGNGDFTKLKDGVELATKYPNTILYVKPGTYNLITEFGDSYFSGFTADTDEASGLQIGNGIKIIFDAKAKVVADCTGKNQYVKSRFSPFNLIKNSTGFTLEGLDLECINCRYGIHDEDVTSATPYKNVYKNCHIKIDNSANASWGGRQCVGGGLGQSGTIEIENCRFESVGVSNDYGIVSYHNGNGSATKAVKNELFIKNNYFEAGTVRVSYYGNHTDMSTAMVSGNSFTSAPIVTAETSSSTVVNIELIEWGNDIRSE